MKIYYYGVPLKMRVEGCQDNCTAKVISRANVLHISCNFHKLILGIDFTLSKGSNRKKKKKDPIWFYLSISLNKDF